MTVVFEGLTVLGMDSFCDQLGMPFSIIARALHFFKTVFFFWTAGANGVLHHLTQPWPYGGCAILQVLGGSWHSLLDFLPMDCGQKCRCFDGKAHVSPVFMAKCE